MIIKENDTKNFLCPILSSLAQKDTYSAKLNIQCCLGKRCACWRWATEEVAGLGFRDSETEGFCGIGWKP